MQNDDKRTAHAPGIDEAIRAESRIAQKEWRRAEQVRAAAPDMLAAAQLALSIIEGFEPENGGHLPRAQADRSITAIAKATQP